MTEPARNHIRFLLNDRTVELGSVSPTATLLDHLRLEQRLRGTKEGCAEGDCGACTVLIGRLKAGELRYETVTACIRFLASLDGCHVVTVEHLASPGGALHPVQQAMVDLHGSQCGFCTPGFVMALYALWLVNPSPSRAEIEKAIQGNLCRCTGYEPIVRAAETMGQTRPAAETDRLIAARDRIHATLAAWAGEKAPVTLGEGPNAIIVPASLEDLESACATHPGATLVAGSTDVGLWVTKHMRPIGPVIQLGKVEALRRIEETADGVTLGAGVSYSEAAPVLARHYPAFGPYLDRVGGEQVRNMGTIGGNIANGSPIGDMPPALIALGASLTLNRAGVRRTLALEDFFIDYGKQDREPGEFVERVTVPRLPENAVFALYKISKRRDEDISAVAAGYHLLLDGDGRVADIRIAYGGMAATPKRARSVELALKGQPWSSDAVEQAIGAFEQDFRPLTDWRASAAYRMLTAKNLLRRFHLETTGETVTLRRFDMAEA